MTTIILVHNEQPAIFHCTHSQVFSLCRF